MSDRAVLGIIAAGVGFATMVYLLGYQFLYWAFFDPDKPYLPEGSEQVVVFVTGSMGAATTLVAAIVTAVVTWKVASKSHEAGKTAALATPPPAEPLP